MMSRADAERSELWLESVERYHERQRQEHRARWYAFHADMADLHARLSEEHAAKAEALCSDDDPGLARVRRENGLTRLTSLSHLLERCRPP